MRAAIYARVSTNNGQDPHMQLGEVREYCQRRDWQIEGGYMDAGISGAKERRPQLDALLASCRKRRVDAVVVDRYDRFALSPSACEGAKKIAGFNFFFCGAKRERVYLLSRCSN